MGEHADRCFGRDFSWSCWELHSVARITRRRSFSRRWNVRIRDGLPSSMVGGSYNERLANAGFRRSWQRATE